MAPGENEFDTPSMYSEILLSHKKILPFAMAWLDLDGLMLSEISQIEKDKCYIILFICGISRTK